jgi:hypothetical protein
MHGHAADTELLSDVGQSPLLGSKRSYLIGLRASSRLPVGIFQRLAIASHRGLRARTDGIGLRRAASAFARIRRRSTNQASHILYRIVAYPCTIVALKAQSLDDFSPWECSGCGSQATAGRGYVASQKCTAPRGLAGGLESGLTHHTAADQDDIHHPSAPPHPAGQPSIYVDGSVSVNVYDSTPSGVECQSGSCDWSDLVYGSRTGPPMCEM